MAVETTVISMAARNRPRSSATTVRGRWTGRPGSPALPSGARPIKGPPPPGRPHRLRQDPEPGEAVREGVGTAKGVVHPPAHLGEGERAPDEGPLQPQD